MAARSRKPAARRLAETVAERIQHDVSALGWRPGTLIGSEPDLIERYGVSRAVFREAARIVEHQQIAAMRRGPGGGLVVTEPDPEVVRSAAGVYLRHRGVSRRDLWSTRVALEVASVEVATARLDEAGIATLKSALADEEAMLDRDVNVGHARKLHATMAELAGNPASQLFIEVLARLDEEMVHEGWDGSADAATLRQRAHESHHAHVRICEAVIAGDAALAQHRMRRHLDAIIAVVDPAEPVTASGQARGHAER